MVIVMSFAERVLDVATLGAPTGLACMKRLAWERSPRGYQRHPGSWGWEQTTIQLTLRGTGQVRPRGRAGVPSAIPVGTALVYASRHHRDLVYGRDDADGGWEFLYLNLIGDAAALTVREVVALRGHVVPLAVDHPVIRDALAALPGTGQEYAAWPIARSAAFAHRLLLALIEQPAPAPAGADDRLAAEAMALMASDLGYGWDVAAIARSLAVSREHLTRVFAARVGAPPARWLREQRISAAARRLRGAEPVAAIARACGFGDAAHFAEVFRLRVGVTPAVFRRQGGVAGW
jgi:AraC-like DNA-binding protein